MKNLIKYFVIFMTLCGLNSCETDLMDYEGDAGVYFAVQHPWSSGFGDSIQWEMCPSTDISFFFAKKVDSTITIRVQILGPRLPQDRYFKMVVVDTGTTATVNHDFDALADRYVMAANTHYTDVKINLHKQSDLAGQKRKVMIRLEETPDFKLPMNTWYPWPKQDTWTPSAGTEGVDISAIEHTLYISDISVAPSGWSPYYFGTFSKTKFDKMCEVLILTYDDFLKESLNPIRSLSIALRMAAYLENFPTPDETGPMEMGEAAKRK